jgi:hypothetical protein
LLSQVNVTGFDIAGARADDIAILNAFLRVTTDAGKWVWYGAF